MSDFAKRLSLSYDSVRTCYSYYRQIRLLQEHYDTDPAKLTEAEVRDYFIYVKLDKEWKPKTIRQSAASLRLFYSTYPKCEKWKVFSQVATAPRIYQLLVLPWQEDTKNEREDLPPFHTVEIFEF